MMSPAARAVRSFGGMKFWQSFAMLPDGLVCEVERTKFNKSCFWAAEPEVLGSGMTSTVYRWVQLGRMVRAYLLGLTSLL